MFLVEGWKEGKMLARLFERIYGEKKSTRSKNQLIVFFDGKPLIILDCGDAIQDTTAILKWYAARYDFDYTRLTCCWCDVIPNLHPLLNQDMGL